MRNISSVDQVVSGEIDVGQRQLRAVATGMWCCGRFQLAHRIAGGGAADVWSAVDRDRDRPVVVKIVPAGRLDDRAVRCTHPGLASWLATGVMPDGRELAVFDLVPGVRLRRLLAAGPLGYSQARSLIAQIARALVAAHDAGFVHGAVTPEHVMVCEDDPAVYPIRATLIGLGVTVGPRSPEYAAPEQLRGDAIDARTDVFALAALTVEMLTGCSPSASRNRWKRDFPARLAHLRPILASALSSDPADRPASIRAFYEELTGRPLQRLAHGTRPGWLGAVLVSMLATGCAADPVDAPTDDVAADVTSGCSFAVTKNVYDGPNWWGTIAFKNTGTTSSSHWTVAFDVPAGVHCDFANSGWTYAQSGTTCTYAKPGAAVAPGSTLSFHYSTDSQAFSAASHVVVTDTSCGSSSSGGSSSTGSGTATTVYVTSYGFNDNDNGAGKYGTAAIAYPQIHSQAFEGTGRFDDPVTFATDANEMRPGTIVYVPYLRKYFIMEDGCVECSDDWANGKRHIDLWMGPDAMQPDAALAACEDDVTRSSATVYVNATNGFPVDTTPLFSNGTCTAHLY